MNTTPDTTRKAKDRYNIQEDLDDLNRFFASEDSHGAILRAHSYLHQILWQFVQTVDLNHSGSQRRPTFHQCLQRARQDGLREQFYEPLRYLNGIRNRFGHEYDAALSREDVEGLLFRFSEEDKEIVAKTFGTMKAQFGWTEDSILDLDTKDAFVFLFIHLWAVLRAALLHGQKVDILPPVVEIARFVDPLLPLYDKTGHLDRLSDDLTYLADAYERMESYWQANFTDMARVGLVILAEAPLFGTAESYIYNPDAPHTNFLYPCNLKPITGQDGQGWSKAELLTALRQLGILVMDIYPYCFNDTDTPFSYPGLSKAVRQDLLRRTLDFHLRPKLERVRPFRAGVRFCVRYKPVQEAARAVLPDVLSELGFERSDFSKIYKQGGMVNPQALAAEYQAAIDA